MLEFPKWFLNAKKIQEQFGLPSITLLFFNFEISISRIENFDYMTNEIVRKS